MKIAMKMKIDKRWALLLVFSSLLVIQAYGQEKKNVKIPGDSSIVKLTEQVIIETTKLKLEIEAGSRIISDAKHTKYKRFEKTLVRVRDRLISQNAKIGELQTEITKLKSTLNEISSITDEDLLLDIKNLAQLKEDLKSAQEDLSKSNSELVAIKTDLDKATKKLEKQKKGGNIIKGIIGAAGIAIGIIIGSAF